MNTAPLIIDTREPFEYQMSHVDNAINIPPDEFMTGVIPEKLKDISKDQLIILYCRSGQRSNTCSMILSQFGFTNVVNGTSEQRVKQMLR
ncbi:rhodanese-like domain-containing protein [Candidatus Nomurabacteria bacterium]|nr:rhodanese-like domain-containing protein [Candidatus Saccharibacteria bacterium]MCA9312829.1 rhodanese-like domain-containing protein [Candidatus Saccharibacteria bacterium]MCB9822268.1 rhodanese-like domain-containing protein [Candidatus Nomurabacteria bacterium]